MPGKRQLPNYSTRIARFTMAQCQEIIEICNVEMKKEAA